MSDNTTAQTENVFHTPKAEKDEESEKPGFKPKVSFYHTTIGRLERLTTDLADSCCSPGELV
jgi:hypothetical protein